MTMLADRVDFVIGVDTLWSRRLVRYRIKG